MSQYQGCQMWHICAKLAHLQINGTFGGTFGICGTLFNQSTVFVLTQSSIGDSIDLCITYCSMIATPIPYNSSEKMDLQKEPNALI